MRSLLVCRKQEENQQHILLQYPLENTVLNSSEVQPSGNQLPMCMRDIMWLALLDRRSRSNRKL